MTRFAVLLGALALSGCMLPTPHILPDPVPYTRHAGKHCDAIAAEYHAASVELANADYEYSDQMLSRIQTIALVPALTPIVPWLFPIESREERLSRAKGAHRALAEAYERYC